MKRRKPYKIIVREIELYLFYSIKFVDQKCCFGDLLFENKNRDKKMN